MKPNEFFNFSGGCSPRIEPQKAILFHRGTAINQTNYYSSESFLASVHDFVVNDRNESVIGAGRLLSKEDVESMLRSILDLGNSNAQLLPSHVLSISERHIAWTVPAQVRPMIFNLRGAKSVIKIMAPWPRLLLVANKNGKLAVAALKTKSRRPTANTKLFNAPLMNVSLNGAVCTGTAALPNGCEIDHLTDWESVMFDSAFSHVNNYHTLILDGNAQNGVDDKQHFRFWNALSKGKEQFFPNQYLEPMNTPLEIFIKEHAKC